MVQLTNPAKYRHRVTLQKHESYQDDELNWVTGWNDHVTVWAKILGLRGKEIIEAGASSVKITNRIYIRYRDGIDETMRIKFGDRYFEIVHVNNLEERNVEIEILANEVRPSG